MKKIILITLFLIIVTCVSYGQYATPNTGVRWNLDSLVGNSSGAITFSGSHYQINQALIVSQTDTVLINTNATVKVASGFQIQITGTLKITPPDSVKITALDTVNMFLGLRFENSPASVLKKMIFEKSNSIRLVNSNILIDSCILRDNILASGSLSSGTIDLSGSSPVISNSKFLRNRRSAIICAANGTSSPLIVNNLFYHNGVSNSNYPQLNLTRNISGTPIVIRNNTVIGNYTLVGGISISTLVGGPSDVIVENNIVKRNRYGIAFTGTGITGIVSGNLIDSNNIQGEPIHGGSGLNFNTTSASPVQQLIVKRNIVRWNLWGVTIQGVAKPIFGDLSSSDTNKIGLNSFYYNSNNSTTPLIDFYNNTPDSIKAENNYWGFSNLDSIEAHIFHKPDNPSLGFVDYLPFYLPTGVELISPLFPKTFKLYEAYPNPFNPGTVIRFDLPKTEIVKLTIFDISGREIRVLINSKLNLGTYKYNFNAEGLSSGVYFFRLIAGNTAQTGRLVFLK